MELFFFRLVNSVLQILPDHRHIGGDFDNVHAVDLAEFLLFRESRTGHAAFLFEFVEEVLEGDGGQGLGFSLDLHVLLGLDGLMETVAVTSAGHDTARKLIYDQDLVVLHHIVLVPEHQVVGSQSQDDIVLDLQVLGIRQVLDSEIPLHLCRALQSQGHDLVLFVDDEVPGLLPLNAHDGVHLGEVFHILAPL